jgi:hypothetical protein
MRSRLLLWCLMVCSCRDSAFNQASKVDNVTTWRAFLETNPSDTNREAAEARLEELEFDEASKAHSIVAYKRFVADHTDSVYTARAKQRLETLRYNSAKDLNSINGWRQFVSEHADGAHHAEALAALATLEEESVVRSLDGQLKDNVAAQNNPNVAEKLLAKRDQRDFESAQSAAQYLDYLTSYPAGAHRDEVKAKLLHLEAQSLLLRFKIDEAEALVAQSALGRLIVDWPEEVRAARRFAAYANDPDGAIRTLFPSRSLTGFGALVASLEQGDWFERSQAAKALRFWITPESIDPLLRVFRSSRSVLVRLTALESLQHVLRMLPKSNVEFELTTRLRALQEKASDENLYLGVAGVYDLLGRTDLALSEYQKALVPDAPDAVVLFRVIALRAERGQYFSSAIVARTLAFNARQVLDEFVNETTSPSVQVQHGCAAVQMSRFALSTIEQARSKRKPTDEFGGDYDEFERIAKDTLALASAKLRDAQLRVIDQGTQSQACQTDAIDAQMEKVETARVDAVNRLLKTPSAKNVAFALSLSARDWSPRVRAAIAEAQATWPKK